MERITFIVTWTKDRIIYHAAIVKADNIRAVEDYFTAKKAVIVKACPAVPYDLDEAERKGFPVIVI